MIRMNVDKETLETGKGLIDVVKKIIWYQIFWKDAVGKDIRLIDLQYKMYNSDIIDPFYIKRKLKLKKEVKKMIKHTNTTCDLRRKNSIADPMTYRNLRINFKDCMVIFVVLTVLLLSILAVSAAPSPDMMLWV